MLKEVDAEIMQNGNLRLHLDDPDEFKSEYRFDEEGQLHRGAEGYYQSKVNDISVFFQTIEWYRCNADKPFVDCLSSIAPEEIGALTGDPFLIGEVDRNGQGEIVWLGRVWHYGNYMIRSPVQDWLEQEYVEMTHAGFVRGEQVLYVPHHARWDWNHHDVLAGFVTSCDVRNRTVYCRYWRTRSKTRGFEDLRTKANSEGADWGDVVPWPTADQSVVDSILEVLQGDS